MDEIQIANDRLPHIAKILKSHKFVPPRFLRSSHVQIFAFLLTPYVQFPQPTSERKFIQLPDGSKLGVNCWFQKDKKLCATIVILNGFEGYRNDKEPRFGKGVAHKAFNAGFNVIFLRQRGEGDTIRLTKSPGDFNADDLPIAMEAFSTWGLDSIYIVGLSLGAWAALLSIGRLHASPPANVSGLVAIAPPTSTNDTWSHIEQRAHFDDRLLKRYKHLIKRRVTVDPPGTWDIKQLNSVKTKRQFFETYKHLFGYPEKFATLEEFFQNTDVNPFLSKLTIPTLIIHAQDDPVVPFEPFTKPKVKNNPNIITLLPKYGSHGCFISDKREWGDLDCHWAQNRAIEFIKLLDKKEAIDDSFDNRV